MSAKNASSSERATRHELGEDDAMLGGGDADDLGPAAHEQRAGAVRVHRDVLRAQQLREPLGVLRSARA